MIPNAPDPLSVGCSACGSPPTLPCMTLRGKDVQAHPRTPHLARSRAVGAAEPRSRISTASPAQVAARERNWSLFQIQGALSALSIVEAKQRLDNEQRKKLCTARDLLRSILDSAARNG